MPKEMARVLVFMKDQFGLTIHIWSEIDLDDIIEHQCISGKSYPLAHPPRCLIFYSNKDRPGCEEEKGHIEDYFSRRSLPKEVITNPNKREFFSKVLQCSTRKNLSGLIVFVLSHGVQGSVEMDDGLLEIREIITQMSRGTDGKPKVCQAEPFILVVPNIRTSN